MSISKIGLSLVTGIAMLLGVCQYCSAQLSAHVSAQGQITNAPSSIFQGASRARTFLKVITPVQGYAAFNAYIKTHPTPRALPPFTGFTQNSPASIACIYGLVAVVASNKCNPNVVTNVPTGGSKAIALVDAYHYPYALTDLQTFSTQFGLPAPNLTVVYASGSQPATSPWPDGGGWELEEALDIQWAHAMAPNAALYLVEAASNDNVDLLQAVQVASNLVAAAGGGQVSMSWGSGEFAGMNLLDSFFQTPKVTYFASSGDNSGVGWPCVSPYVICVGGTTLRMDATGNFLQEVAWVDGGGGPSQFYARPTFQAKVASAVGAQRGVPDVASAADPNNGAWMYYTASDTGFPLWVLIGGTSWSSPTMAGIVNAAGGFSASSTAELTKIYTNMSVAADFRDIVDGYCSFAYGDAAVTGWDYCTGVGVAKGLAGK
jgi:subtilase family serine protease